MSKQRPKKSGGAAPVEQQTWYQRFGLFFFNKARVTLLLWVLLASFGATAYSTLLTREGFPDVAAPYSTVNGTYFVNDAQRIDKEIAQPLVRTIQEVDGVKNVGSQASNNFFGIQIEFEESVKPDEGSSRVEQAVKTADILPANANAQFSPLYVSSLTPEGDDVLISVSSTSLDTQTLQTRADAVANALRADGSAAIADVERVQVVDAFQRGTDPATGKTVSEQQKFDWIANVKDGQLMFANSALVAVQAKDGTDILDLDDAIQSSLATLRSDKAFDDIEVQVAADLATDVRSQVNSLQENLFGGLIAVVVVSFLLISLRASLIAALTMVTVLAITVGLLYVFGLTLNVIVLFSLILSLGLIVDDSTIVTEAIDKARRSGAKPRAAVSTALRKIALASVAGTLTTMLGFAPLLFIGGILGDFIRAIPITIILSLAVSLVVSMSLIPFLSRFILLKGKPREMRNPIARAEEWTGHALAQLIRRLQTNRNQGVLIGLTAIVLSLVLFGAGRLYMNQLKFDIFPPSKDGNVLIANITFDSETVDDAAHISRSVNDTIAQAIGAHATRVSYRGNGTKDNAQIVIDLTPYQDRDFTAPELSDALQQELNLLDGVSAKVGSASSGPPAGAFSVQVKTEDSVKAEKLAHAVEGFLENRAIERQNGTTAQITSVSVSGADSVSRSNGERYVQVDAEYDADDISALVTLTQEEIRQKFPEDRLDREFGLPADALNFDVGQEAENQESFQSMMIAFPLLLLAMYVLLVIQFRSVSQPLMIFLAIPFSFFGAMGGLYFTDNPFSFFAMLAIFALLGISVNNTILLTAYANQARAAGMGRIEAMASAVEERFRPLLATSITTAVALVPLALSDPFWESLAVTLIFGLLSSTFLVIVAFPYYYLGNELIRSRFNRWRVLAWLGVLIGVSVLLGFTASKLVGGFIGLYLLGTFVYIAWKALKRRRIARSKP